MNACRTSCFVALLLLAGCSDETQLSEEVLTRNFSLPCETLEIEETAWNPDLNVLVVKLGSHPDLDFKAALRARGWTYLRDKPFITYIKDNMFLEHHGAEKKLVIRSTLYLSAEEGTP